MGNHKLTRVKVTLEVIVYQETTHEECGPVVILEDADYMIECQGTTADVVSAVPIELERVDAAALPVVS